jgi:heat shock protein HslJ
MSSKYVASSLAFLLAAWFSACGDQEPNAAERHPNGASSDSDTKAPDGESASSDSGTAMPNSNAAVSDDVVASLAGRAFLLQSAQGFEPRPGTRPRISFRAADEWRERELDIDGSCNIVYGPFDVRDGRLLTWDFASTLAFCLDGSGSQDRLLWDFIASEPDFSLDADVLTLAGTEMTLVFLDREIADPDRPLVGPVWRVTMITKDGKSGWPLTGTAQIEFGQDGGLRVEGNCVSGRGSYTLAGTMVTLTGVVFMPKMCSGEPMMPSDDRLIAVISDGAFTFEIEAAQLTLRRGADGLDAKQLPQ